MVITPKFNLLHEFMWLMYPVIVSLIFLNTVHFDGVSLEAYVTTEFIEIFTCRRLFQGVKFL